ncbi:MAG: RNA methyltransferase [Syntrophales bacterium]|nr:RNA methyltransferase [Syntrophales bacterium]
MERRANLDNVAIVLQRPRYAGNVGSVARCGKNMGIHRLIVSQAGPFSREEMVIMATRFAADIVDSIKYADNLENALSDFNYVLGTTARLGAARGPAITPREAAKKIADISQNNRVAIVFGSEDKGLSNEELKLCHAVVTIPVSDEFRSINLSHAVMIVCYEIFVASLPEKGGFTPKLATVQEVEGMYTQLKEVLCNIGFLNPQNPEHGMRHLRRFFSRTHLYARDVKVIRGILRQITWALNPDRGS